MEVVRCHIHKNWLSDNGYIDVFSPNGGVARLYKDAYRNLSEDITRQIAPLLVELIVSPHRRYNVVQHDTYIMEYDIDLTIDEMTYIAELPITELFESFDELPIHFGTPEPISNTNQ
jgi:hypothetical protein